MWPCTVAILRAVRVASWRGRHEERDTAAARPLSDLLRQSCWSGDDDDVVFVVAGCAVEGAAAGDEGESRWSGSAEELGGELRLGYLSSSGDAKVAWTRSCVVDGDAVAGRELSEVPEDPGPAVAVDMADEYGGPGLAGACSESIPPDVIDVGDMKVVGAGVETNGDDRRVDTDRRDRDPRREWRDRDRGGGRKSGGRTGERWTVSHSHLGWRCGGGGCDRPDRADVRTRCGAPKISAAVMAIATMTLNAPIAAGSRRVISVPPEGGGTRVPPPCLVGSPVGT